MSDLAFQKELYRRYNRNPSIGLELFMDTIGKHLVSNYAPSHTTTGTAAAVELIIPGQEGRLKIAARDGKQVHEAVTETILLTPVSRQYKVTLHDAVTDRDVTEDFKRDVVDARNRYPSITARINGQAIQAIRRKVEVPPRHAVNRIPHLERYCKEMIVAARARAAGMSAFEIETEPHNVVKFSAPELHEETGYRGTEKTAAAIGERISQHILQEQQTDVLKPIAHVDSQLLQDVMYEVRKHDALLDLVPIDMQFRNEQERQAVDAHYDALLMKHHDLVPIGSSVASSTTTRALPKLVPIGSKAPSTSARVLPKLVPIGSQARIGCHGKPYSKNKDEDDEDDQVNQKIGCHTETCEQMTVCRGGVCTSQTRCMRHRKKMSDESSKIEEIDAPIRRSALPSIDGLFSDIGAAAKDEDPLLAGIEKRVTLLNKKGSPRGRSLVADSYRTRQAGRFIEFRTRNGDRHVIEDHRVHRVNGDIQPQRVRSVTQDDQSLYIHFE